MIRLMVVYMGTCTNTLKKRTKAMRSMPFDLCIGPLCSFFSIYFFLLPAMYEKKFEINILTKMMFTQSLSNQFRQHRFCFTFLKYLSRAFNSPVITNGVNNKILTITNIILCYFHITKLNTYVHISSQLRKSCHSKSRT